MKPIDLERLQAVCPRHEFKFYGFVIGRETAIGFLVRRRKPERHWLDRVPLPGDAMSMSEAVDVEHSVE